MARRDVDLVIRAQDKASATVNSVADALKILQGAQADAGQGAKGATALLAQLGQQLSRLEAQAKALAAFQRVSKDLEGASSALEGISREAANAAAAEDKLAQQSAKLTAESTRLQAALDKTQKKLTQQDRAASGASAAQAKAAAQVKTAQTAYSKLERSLARVKAPTQAQTAELGRLATALQQAQTAEARAAERAKPLIAAREASAGALARDTAALKTNGSALKANEKLLERARADAQAQAQALQRAQTAYNGLQASATTLSTALGEVVADQSKVGQTALQVARDVSQLSAALKRQEGVAAQQQAAQPGFQRRQYIEALRDLQNLKAQAQAATAPSDALNAALLLARERATRAGEAYRTFAAQLQATAKAARATAAATSTRVPQVQQVVAPSTSPALRRTRTETQLLVGALLRGTSAAEAFNLSLRRVGDGSRTTLNLMQRLRGQILSVTASMVGLYSAFQQLGTVVQDFRALEAVEGRLSQVFNSDVTKTEREVRFLRGEADRLGLSFRVLGAEYSKFAVAANIAGFENENIRRIFISVAEAARVNRLSIEQVERVMLALTQIINKGKIQAEELTQQLGESLPGAASLFAEAMGFGADGTAELFAAMENGLATTEPRMLAFADALERRFGAQLPEALERSGTQLDRFQNSIFESRLIVAESGFIDELTKAVVQFNEVLRSEEGRDALRALGIGLANLVSFIPTVIQNFEALTRLLVGFASVKIAKGFLNLTANLRPLPQTVRLAYREVLVLRRGFSELATSSTLAGRSIGTLGVNMLNFRRGALLLWVAVRRTVASLGGLAGIPLAIGIGMLIDAFLSWESAIDRANGALDKSEAILDKVRDAFAGAETEIEGVAQALNKVTLAELDAELLRTRRALTDLLDAGPGTPQFRDGAAANEFLSLPKEQSIAFIQKQLRDGQISLRQFRERLVEVANLNLFAPDFVDKLLEFVRAVEKGETNTEGLEAALANLRGSATRAQQALFPLKETTRGLFGEAAIDAQKFLEAIDKIRSKLPGMADELQRVRDLREIDEAEAEALAAVAGEGSFRDARRRQISREADAARASINDRQTRESLERVAQQNGLTVDALRRLVDEEGVRLQAYRANPNDPYTIGIGHTGAAGGIQPTDGMTITRQEALDQFSDDISQFTEQVNELVKIPITDAMRAALVSLQFNSGALGSADGRRKIIDPLNRGDFAAAQAGIREFRPTGAGGTISLQARRDREADLFGSQGLSGGLAQRTEELRAQEKLIEAQEEYNKRLDEENEARMARLALIGREENRRLAVEEAVAAAEQDAARRGLRLDRARRIEIEATVGATFDAEKEAERRKAEQDYANAIRDTIAEREREIEVLGILDEREQARLRAVQDALADAVSRGVTPTPELLAAAEQSALALFDAESSREQNEAQRDFNAQVAERLQLLQFENQLVRETARQQAILRAQEDLRAQAAEAGVAVTQQQLDAIGQLVGRQFDLANAEREITELNERRVLLQEQLAFIRENGDVEAERALREQLQGVNVDLQAAIQQAIAFYQALGGEGSANAILRLQNLAASIQQVAEEGRITRRDIEQAFASTMTQSVMDFARAVADGENAIKSLGGAFQSFASSFLIKIGEMLIQMAALRIAMAVVGAVGGAFAGSAAGGGATTFTGQGLPLGGGFVPVAHTGGIIGQSVLPTRPVSAAWFANARRFHSGGMPGLKSNEVAAILEKGEEVLPETDPRHAANGGGSGGVRIVNAFDAASFMEQSLNSRSGERAILNFVRANSGAVKAALG